MFESRKSNQVSHEILAYNNVKKSQTITGVGVGGMFQFFKKNNEI